MEIFVEYEEVYPFLTRAKWAVQDFFRDRLGILFGSYKVDKSKGKANYYPHFEWKKGFKCIPLPRLGNLYLIRPAKPLFNAA